MDIQVLFFAQARDEAGAGGTRVALPDDATLRDLRNALVEAYGLSFQRYGFALNEEWADDGRSLRDGDEVAVLPPISGGDLPLISDAPLVPQDAIDAVSHPGAGAVVCFVGTVRDQFEGAPTRAVLYEGYRSMAERELEAILRRAEGRQEGVRAMAVHRLGCLDVGEISVVIAASAPHRDQAFSACRAIIEDIKTSLPVWKKEIGPEGKTRWHDA